MRWLRCFIEFGMDIGETEQYREGGYKHPVEVNSGRKTKKNPDDIDI